MLQTDKTKRALSVCKKGTERFNSSVSLWSEYLRLKVLNKGNDLVFGLFFHSIVSMYSRHFFGRSLIVHFTVHVHEQDHKVFINMLGSRPRHSAFKLTGIFR